MNLIFAGTPEFAVPVLKALLDAGHTILAVYTQPDRPAGRGRKLGVSAVKKFALARDLPVHQPVTLKSDSDAETLRALKPDALIVIAYGLILPAPILAIPKYGCINVHASLLPRWRGAAPIQRAIEAGDDLTGVTIMQMDAGLDTGAILALAATPIHAHDTAASLHDRLAEIGAPLLVSTLARLVRGDITPQAQDSTHATYAAKLKKEEARIDWNADAALIARRVRAFNPWPVAHTTIGGQVLRLWHASAEMDATAMDGGSAENAGAVFPPPAMDGGRSGLLPSRGITPSMQGRSAGRAAIPPGITAGAVFRPTTATQPPGTLLGADASGVRVQCGRGVVCLTQLQSEGGKVLDAQAFLNGRPLPAGTRLGT